MKTMPICLASASLLVMACAASSAHAAIASHATRASYEAATISNTTITFDGLSADGGSTAQGDFHFYPTPLILGPVSFSDPGNALFVLEGGYYGEGFSSDYFNDNSLGIALTVSFAAPVYGFAMDATALTFIDPTDLGFTFSFAGGSQTVGLPSGFALEAPRFVGFTSDAAFGSVTITSATGSLALDNFTYATALPVPEPGSLALASVALTALAAARRRRR